VPCCSRDCRTFRSTRTDLGSTTPLSCNGDGGYAASLDAAIYAWSRPQEVRSLTEDLAATLHDYAITDALDEATTELDTPDVVGVMGGHALLRTDGGYHSAANWEPSWPGPAVRC
jgi:hypothetical protein